MPWMRLDLIISPQMVGAEQGMHRMATLATKGFVMLHDRLLTDRCTAVKTMRKQLRCGLGRHQYRCIHLNHCDTLKLGGM